MSLRDLPTELKASILDPLLDDQETLPICRLISRDFDAIATTLAFRILNLSRKWGRYARFIELFPEVRPSILDHVQAIHFRALEKSADVFQADVIFDTIALFSHCAKFPSLRAVRLYFNHEFHIDDNHGPEFGMSPARHLQFEIFERLALSASYRQFQCLQELEIDGLLAVPNKSFRLEGIKTLFANLTTLQVRLVTNDAADFNLDEDDYYYLTSWIELSKILAATPNLEVLTLISDEDTRGFQIEDWKKINLPKLKHLCLGRIVFPPLFMPSYGGPECFILRHGKTLEKIDLSSCSIGVLANDPVRWTWAMMWRNFEAALPCLRFFKYDPLPGNHLLEDELSWFVGYALRRAGRRFIRNFDEDPVDITSDGVAYASLQRVLEEKRS